MGQRLALVTGASAGIGRETVRCLHQAGVAVVAVARRAELLRELATLPDVHPVAADVTRPDDLAHMVHTIGSRHLDFLFHGAGIFPRGRLETLPAAEWEHAWATNVTSRLRLTLALRASLTGGRVLFIGSDAARTAREGGGAYSITQAASEMLWRCCQVEIGADIACGLFKPGLVATAMLDASLHAPRDTFPAGAVYEAMRTRGETIAAATVARFIAFLLLDVPRAEFARDEWDIRDPNHHPRWLQGPLYLPPER